MVRRLSGIFGVGLAGLWFYELSANAAPWLTWLDFIAAAGAFGLAAGLNNRSSHLLRIGGPISMATCLFALGIISLSTGAAPLWQIWWNFGFAVAFLLTGLGAAILGDRYREVPRHYHYRPYASHSNGVFGAGYGYSWEPYGPMGGFDYSRKETGHSGRGPGNYKRSDVRIEEDVNDRLTDHWGVDASDILVTVKNQEVWLQGRVDSRRAKRMAEELADSVSGVKDVKNELQIRSKENTSPVKAVRSGT